MKIKILAVLSLVIIVILFLVLGHYERKERVFMAKTIKTQEASLVVLTTRLNQLDSILEARKNGRRKNPFRCTDAKKYFKKLNIKIDCVAIEDEVNGYKY